jgi:hypothetical protein
VPPKRIDRLDATARMVGAIVASNPIAINRAIVDEYTHGSRAVRMTKTFCSSASRWNADT